MSTANATTPQPRKLDADTVRKRLQDADAFCRQLGLIAPTATRKVRHNVKCPWCGGTMSVWVARENVVGSCKGACPTTHNPFAIIGKVRGLASRGEDFLRILEIGDAIAGGAATTLATAPTTPQRTPTTATVPPKAEPTTPQTQEVDGEDDEPVVCKLHPENTPAEWAWVDGLGVDPHVVRDRDWLRVLNEPQTSPQLETLRAKGYTIILDDEIAVSPSTGSILPVRYADAFALSEVAREVVSVGPRSLAAWPTADRDRPELYIALSAGAFVAAEAALQRRFLPVALSTPQLATSLLKAIPRATTLVILTDPSTPPSVGAKVIVQAASAGVNAMLRPMDTVIRPKIHVVDRLGLPDDDTIDGTLRSMGALN
jgi:hypothetical protein